MENEQLQQVNEMEGFDMNSIILRRADPDDADAIAALVDVGKDDVYNRVYQYPRILNLIETSYLAITVLDRDANVVAFGAFEDYPTGMRGMQDEKHYNYWEQWFQEAYQVEDFSAMNTLWLSYFVAGGIIKYDQQRFAFKRILQTVYTSMPDIIGILFLARGDADEEDIGYCFDPLSMLFEEVALKDEEVLRNVRGISPASRTFFSSRVLMLPFIEIRKAHQEDHDDLADVFNNQSETVTEAYGEYFLAEMIAAQNEHNNALVAQVKDKAVGLMGLTDEVDISLLHRCFELNHYDNLLKPEFMDAIKKRREYLEWDSKVSAEKKRIEFLKRLKQETMQCNIIAQRISLQEYLITKEEEIMAEIDGYLNEPETLQELDASTVNSMLDKWLSEFELQQPSAFFAEHPTQDTELFCNTQSVKEFCIHTLEYFDLPKKYMDGHGHFPDFEKQRAEAKAKKGAKKGKKPVLSKAQQKKLEELNRKRGVKNKADEDARPTHFDIEIFKKVLKRFTACNGEMRSNLRTKLLDDMNKTRKCFLDQHGEMSYKKVVDVYELAELMHNNKFNLSQDLMRDLGAILVCFGEIEYESRYGNRIPPETEDQRRAAIIAASVEDKIKAAREAGEEINEEELRKGIPNVKKREPCLMLLHLISITDMKFCVQKMFEFDKALYEMGIQKYSTDDEQLRMSLLTKQFKKKFYEEDEVYEMPTEPSKVYSDNPEIQKIVEGLDNQTDIPDVPDSLKNAFAVTLFCMEAAFDSRSTDFLKHAFEQFPDRDYLIVTQPHTIVESQLLRNFTQPYKKTINTFQHVLYIMHRDSLYHQDMSVSRVTTEDLEGSQDLIAGLEESKKFYDALYDCAVNPSSTNYGFVAKVEGDVIGSFVVSKDVNLDYYISHFHIQDQILLGEQDMKAHSRLIHSCINPIFERSTRFMLKELLRMTAKNCLYFEVDTSTIIPSIFHELVHVRSRRFPHFLDKKWDHERYVSEQTLQKQKEDISNKVDGSKRDPLDEQESPFALCFATRRMLSEPKIVKNARIVVVGASDTSISFIEALLSINYLQFTNVTLVAPGGMPHHHFEDKKDNLKAYSTSYTKEELKKLMLESRIRIIDARMVDIDKNDKNIILEDDSVIPYDTLVLGMGIQDKTLNKLGYRSRGISTGGDKYERADQILSIDDPQLYDHLRPGGTLINNLTDKKRVKNCVIYGRTLNTYCLIQGLIARGVNPKQIILAVPESKTHIEKGDATDADMPHIYPDAFEDEDIEAKVQGMCEKLGVQIMKNMQLFDIGVDNEEGLEYVAFRDLSMPEPADDDEDDIDMIEDSGADEMSQEDGTGGDDGGDADDSQDEHLVKNKPRRRKKNEKEVDCRVLITAGHRDVDQDVFLSIHNNGLVYNGRLIVEKSFQTTDPSIFAAGSLCEFTGRYKPIAQGRSLRMDRYNGREMGARLARSVFDIYDSQANLDGEDNLPTFYLPQGQGGVLPNDIIYYHIRTTNPLIFKPGTPEVQNRNSLTCDNLDNETGKGHFIKFTFNSIGQIDSVTYMGSEEIVLQSLWSFVGLHENYLNQLTSRFEKGIIPNVVEFLSENWAIALYHEWFGDFCLRMRNNLQSMGDVEQVLKKAFDMTKNGQGITREEMEKLIGAVDPKTINMIQEDTLEFVKTNMNHLPMYYIPGKEFK